MHLCFHEFPPWDRVRLWLWCNCSIAAAGVCRGKVFQIHVSVFLHLFLVLCFCCVFSLLSLLKSFSPLTSRSLFVNSFPKTLRAQHSFLKRRLQFPCLPHCAPYLILASVPFSFLFLLLSGCLLFSPSLPLFVLKCMTSKPGP